MMIRDERSKAILNTDAESLNKYKKEREQARKIEMLCVELKEVKNKLAEVLKLIEKNT
jgi:tRNA U34 5-carboxymethylaminomethyl modifying GTPase MnmE/TrmE